MNIKKRIGIISAMDVETNLIVRELKRIKTESVVITNFYLGTLFDVECVVATSGVGKVCAAACTQAMIMKFNPDFILNVGIAGSLSEHVKINDFVIADSVIQYDLDKTAIGHKLGLISGLNIVNVPCARNINEKIILASQKVDDARIHTGVIATGDTFVANDKLKNNIVKNFNALACDMEGGGVGQVCYMNNVDFSVVRKISDNADENSLVNYDEFELRACERMSDVIFEFIHDFKLSF